MVKIMENVTYLMLIFDFLYSLLQCKATEKEVEDGENEIRKEEG